VPLPHVYHAAGELRITQTAVSQLLIWLIRFLQSNVIVGWRVCALQIAIRPCCPLTRYSRVCSYVHWQLSPDFATSGNMTFQYAIIDWYCAHLFN
jgi:hypothetical protein